MKIVVGNEDSKPEKAANNKRLRLPAMKHLQEAGISVKYVDFNSSKFSSVLRAAELKKLLHCPESTEPDEQ